MFFTFKDTPKKVLISRDLQSRMRLTIVHNFHQFSNVMSINPRHWASRRTTSNTSRSEFSEPPSPASAVEAAVGKAELFPAKAEVVATAPISSVHGASSSRGRSGSSRRGVDVIGAGKSEHRSTAGQISPQTPRTEEASPAPIPHVGMLPQSATTSPSSRVNDAPHPTGVSTVLEAGASMFVLPLGALSASRGFPSFKAANRSGVLVSCDSLDRSSAFVVFVSHRWVADGGDPGGGPESGRPELEEDGRGSCRPDVDCAKHALVVEALSMILPSLPRWVGVYVWIDCCCIDLVRYDTIFCRISSHALLFNHLVSHFWIK